MLGAALLALDGLAPVIGGMSAGRLVVCPTPIGNLEDVTLRVLAALREADVVACEDTRRTRVLLDRYGVSATLVSLPRAQRARAGGRARASGCAGGAVVALVSDAGMPLVSDPGFVLVAGVRGGGAGGRGAAGAERGAGRAGRVGAAGRDVAVRRASCRARRRSSTSAVRRLAGDAGGVRVAASRVRGVAGACWRRWTPSGRSAVCRELTKVHEEVVRGHGRRAGGALRGRAPPRGEVVLVVGARAARPRPTLEPAVDAVRRLVEAGAQAAARGRAWWPS